MKVRVPDDIPILVWIIAGLAGGWFALSGVMSLLSFGGR